MTIQESYLLVEGQQDVYFVGRILQEFGLRIAERADQIPLKWRPFLDGAACQRDSAERTKGRSPLPFWQLFKPALLFSDSLAVVIERVDGNRVKFRRTIRATDALIDGGLASLQGVGILPDADVDPLASLASAQESLRSVGLAAPSTNQEVTTGSPNTGIFVLPGGADSGGLEEVLLDCAQAVYPSLLTGARNFVGAVDVDCADYSVEDMREMRTPQGPTKAIVGSLSSVLKPGSTIQVSVLRDRWVSGETLRTPRVAALVQFLRTLCGIS